MGTALLLSCATGAMVQGDRGGAAGCARLGATGMGLAHVGCREGPDKGFAQAELFMLGLMEPCWSSNEQYNSYHFSSQSAVIGTRKLFLFA